MNEDIGMTGPSRGSEAVERRRTHDPGGLNGGHWPPAPEAFITPAGEFFSRSHGAVPALAATSWRLEVDGLVERPAAFSLADLSRSLPATHVTATLICAGLRRAELMALRPIPGEVPWGPEPAGTAHWSGFALRDLLAAVGVDPRARHVEFAGLDRIEREGATIGFGASIDLDKALSPEVILATGMNGSVLAPERGFPMRVVVPGWIGARSVKWLGRVRLLAEPSANYFQARAYRVQRDESAGGAGESLTGAPLNAVITSPTEGASLRPGGVVVRGWAFGTGGSVLRSVEVSADGGRGWISARIVEGGGEWTWGLWRADLQLGRGEHVLVARAADSTGATQPASAETAWNVKGYANNAWHRVRVRVG